MMAYLHFYHLYRLLEGSAPLIIVISLNFMDKVLGFTSYKEASARIYFDCHFSSHSCGVKLLKHSLLLSLWLFLLMCYTWRRILVDVFALLDDNFLQLGF
jgi:hypothetical protein